MTIKTENLPRLQSRAAFQPTTMNAQARTVDLTWGSPEPVLRGYFNQFNEVLSFDPSAVNLDRLNSGAPLLNNHSQYDLGDIIGVVERAWIEGGIGHATVRFPEAGTSDESDQMFKMVSQGIIRNVSVGYTVNEYEEQGAPEGEIPTYLAVDWEPAELSLVCVPADATVGVRSSESEKTFPVKIRMKEVSVEPEVKPAPAPAPTIDLDAVRKEERAAVKKHASEVRALVRKSGFADEIADGLIDNDHSLDQVRSRLLDLHIERGAAPTKPANGTIEIVAEERSKVATGMEDAIMNRLDSRKNPVTDAAREFVGMTLSEIARESLRKQGVTTTGLSRMELAGRALHTTSDFAGILANVVNKTLRKAYSEAPNSYEFMVNEVDVSDFKPISRVQLGDGPQLEKVPESGEIKRGSFGDSAETYQVQTFAKIIGVTRQVIVNDDMNALSRIPQAFGAAGRSLISDAVWGLIINGTTGATMYDGTSLFTTQHGNIDTTAGGIMAALPNMRTKMKNQMGTSGRYLNLQPKYLLVGTGRETEAEGVISPLIFAQQASNVNTFARTLQIVAEPRLPVGAFYLVADPSQIDLIEIAYLQGQRGIYSEQRMGFDVDGMEIKARLDFGVKALDWRGFVRNAGT